MSLRRLCGVCPAQPSCSRENDGSCRRRRREILKASFDCCRAPGLTGLTSKSVSISRTDSAGRNPPRVLGSREQLDLSAPIGCSSSFNATECNGVCCCQKPASVVCTMAGRLTIFSILEIFQAVTFIIVQRASVRSWNLMISPLTLLRKFQ